MNPQVTIIRDALLASSWLSVKAELRDNSQQGSRIELLRDLDIATRNPGVDPPDLQRLMAGDADEWVKAFKWLRPLAFSRARSILARYQADVEDVVSDSLHKLRKRVPEMAPSKIGELKALTMTFTKQCAQDFLSKKRAKKRPDEVSFPTDIETGGIIEPSDPRNPGSRLSERDLMRLINKLTEDLSPIEREVYNYRCGLGLKYREIGQKLGITGTDVGNHWLRIRKKLRKWLRDLGEDYS